MRESRSCNEVLVTTGEAVDIVDESKCRDRGTNRCLQTRPLLLEQG